MKKILALLMVLCMVLSFVACNKTEPEVTTEAPAAEFDPAAKSEGVMTYAEYDAAALEAEVTIEAYVQATQSWWDNKITAYLQDPDGAYFCYEMACSEADAAKLVPGTKIKVTGTKGAWALLCTDGLIQHQNKFVTFKGLTVVKVEYKNGEPGDDIYVTVSKDGAEYSFCVERYLTGPETEVYAAVGALQAGDTVDIDGFLYWYEGVNTHITAVAKK